MLGAKAYSCAKMGRHSLLWHYLWVAPHLLQIALAAIIFKRKLHREFPVFFAYTIYQVLGNAVLFTLDHWSVISADIFRLAVNIDGAISIALRFVVIYEIFVIVFRPYETLKRLASVIVHFTLLALLIVALVVAAYGPVAAYASRLISLYIAMGRAAAIVQCGLLLLLFAFSTYFGISWRSFVFGVASALGFYLTVQLGFSALSSHIYVPHADLLEMLAYHLSVVGWLFYAWAPQPDQLAVKSIPQHQLESWNIELERLLQR
jgi:hypothetical protein